jgi:hypothetical protein
MFSGTTSSDALLNEFTEDILARHNIAIEKVVAVVTDTTGNMGMFGKLLRETFDVKHNLLRGSPNPQDCHHCQRRQVHSSRKWYKEMLSQSHAILQFIYASPRKNAKPLQDNVTRWWSTYKSISRYLDDGVGDHITLLISHGEIGGSCADLSPTHKMVLKDV